MPHEFKNKNGHKFQKISYSGITPYVYIGKDTYVHEI